MLTKQSKGIYFALLTAFVSGFSIFINKYAVGAITPPLVFTTVKNSIVGILVITLLLAFGKSKQLKTISKENKNKLLLIGIIGGALPFYLFFTGISMIPAINAAIIHKTLILWVAILAGPFLKEYLTKGQLVGVLLLFVGNLFVGGFKGFIFSTGEFYVIGATVLWAIETIIAKKVLEDVDSDIVVAARMGIGSLILIIASSVVAPTSLVSVFNLQGVQVFWLIATSLALVAYLTTWYKALSLAPATLVTSVLVLSTIITNILSAVFTTNSLEPMFIPQFGVMLLGAAIYLVNSKKLPVVAEISN